MGAGPPSGPNLVNSLHHPCDQRLTEPGDCNLLPSEFLFVDNTLVDVRICNPWGLPSRDKVFVLSL